MNISQVKFIKEIWRNSEKDFKWLEYDLNNTKLPILMF